jgi:hypothetical protein
MANKVTKLTDPTGVYSGGYTSTTYKCSTANNSNNNSQRGVIQVELESGEVALQVRLTADAPWFTARVYTSSIVEEMVLTGEVRVIATNKAHVWIAELL